MRSKSAEIQERINELEQLIQGEASDFQKTSWETELEQKKADLINTFAEEAQQQERIDAQTEMVESITLAYDYNEILGNPMANETIIENIKQYRLQDSEEHYAEVSKLKFEFAAKLEITEELWKDAVRENIQLQERLKAENEQAQLDAIEIMELSKQVAQLGLEKQEAEQGRDNAAQLLVEANEEVEKHKQSTIENCDLRQQIEALKQELTAKKALTVSGNEKLAELAAKAKESTAAAAARGIERWNTQYGMDIPVLEVPDAQPVNNVTETDEAAEIQPFPETEVQTTELGLADQSLSFSGEETDDHTSEIAEDELNRATPANMSHIKALSDQIEFLKGSLQTTIARVDYMVGQAVA